VRADCVPIARQDQASLSLLRSSSQKIAKMLASMSRAAHHRRSILVPGVLARSAAVSLSVVVDELVVASVSAAAMPLSKNMIATMQNTPPDEKSDSGDPIH
jgi:hypothetical protein